MAGGFFWMAAILIGAVWGVSAGNPMKGILIGTALGALIAIAVWLVDRARRRTYPILRPDQITRPMQLMSSIPQSGQSG